MISGSQTVRSSRALALLLGIASLALGLFVCLAGLTCVIILVENRLPWYAYIHLMSGPRVVPYALIPEAVAVMSGTLAIRIARRGDRSHRTSSASTAIRFGVAGLTCSTIFALALVTLLTYRWLHWG